MPVKPKLVQPATPEVRQGRDFFRTPRYAVDILIPYLQQFKGRGMIWECAAGDGHISNVLYHAGFQVRSTDIVEYESDNIRVDKYNFLSQDLYSIYYDVSCIVTNPPFSVKKKFYDTCKGSGLPFALLIPADYSQWTIKAVREDGCQKLVPTKRVNYITPYDIEDSQAQFHSMWLTWGLNLPSQETFVDMEN